MMKRFPLVLFGVTTLALASARGVHAQEPPASAPAGNRVLEEALARINAIDTETAKKIAAVLKVVDAELIAKRITDSAAQSLRFGLRAISPSGGPEALVNAWSAARLPAENTALTAAMKSLEADLSAAEAERLALIKKAAADVRASVTTAVRSAKTVAEVDALLTAVERLQQAIPMRNTATNTMLGTQHLLTQVNALRHLRKVIDLQAGQSVDTPALTLALSQFQSVASSSTGAMDEFAVQERIQGTLAPYQKAQDDAQENVESVLQAGKSSKEITAAIIKLEEAIERFPSLSSYSKKRDITSAVEVYRNLATARASFEEGKHAQAKNQLTNVRSYSLKPLGAAKAPIFTQLVNDWTKAFDEEAATASAKRRDEVRTRIAEVKRPADLEKLSLELAKAENESRDRDLDFPRGLASQLSALAAAWTASSPNLLRSAAYENMGDVRFAKEMAELRRRVERDVLASSLRLPELLQLPLAEKPLEEAIDAITAQMAEKGEWRRMLQLIETRSGQSRSSNYGFSPTSEVDLAGALRAYIAGQNMELAEQWVEAMQSYKAVLRATSERAPTKQAAERVKALTKAHADLFKPAPPPATPAPAPVPPALKPE